MLQNKPHVWLIESVSPPKLDILINPGYQTFAFDANPQDSDRSNGRLTVKCYLSGTAGTYGVIQNLFTLDSASGYDPAIHTKVTVKLINSDTGSVLGIETVEPGQSFFG